MNSFKLTAKAKIDLKNIAVFTEKKWGRAQRNAYLLEFDRCFHNLADNPEIGINNDHIKTDYRQFPHGSHLIFYKVNNKRVVEIIRILHKNMLPKFHLNKT